MDGSKMDRKSKILPVLSNNKSKTTMAKDKLKIEELFMSNSKNRQTYKDYRHEEEFSALKAANFVSRIDTIDSPQIVFTISDHIRELVRDKNKENLHENSQPTSITNRKQAQFVSAKSTMHYRPNEDSNRKIIAEERYQALNLARWMDEKLKVFRNKKILTFMDILEYKQTILNYALGKIIDSLTKKCKEEGQILSLIWNNTFTMFESVFNVLLEANSNKKKEKTNEAKQLHQMFEVNHNFLREQNAILQKENKEIFQKMRNVILWNKRLRRQRKQLTTTTRMLEYRNTTYGQALQQTLQMLLQSTPEPSMITAAKKIILKLGREKNRKKHFYKQEIDSELSSTTKEMVYSWLKKNSYMNEDKLQMFKQTCFNKEDRFIFSEIEDINEMNKVNIYDFFKLYDVAVQVSPQTSNNFAQCDKKVYKNADVMTKNISSMEHGCQTMNLKRDSKASIDIITSKKHVEINSKQSSRSKYFEKSKGKPLSKGRQNGGLAGSSKNVRQQNNKNSQSYEWEKYERHKDGRRRSNHDIRDKNKMNPKYVEEEYSRDEIKEYTRNRDHSIGKIDEEHAQSQRVENTSISDLIEEDHTTKGLITTKHLITNNSNNGRQRSLYDFADNYNSNSSKVLGQMNSNLRRSNHKRSVAYIRNEFYTRPIAKLKQEKFNQTYKDQKQMMDNNKEQFYDQIIRRRSFFTKRRVQFANFKEAEDLTERTRQWMRGGKNIKNYKKHFYESANYVSNNVDRLTKKTSAPSNIAKTRTLLTAKSVFLSITSSIEQIARIPPKNKVFVNNNLASLTKYISALIHDYIKQIKKEKEDLAIQCQKALYPLNILLMERMTFKYGLKDIAEKKIKNFIEKIMTFATISQKIGLYSLLLGLEDDQVGSDELLVYLKCIVYFDTKKMAKDIFVDSTIVDIEIVRENLRKILQYFFDHEYVNLLELKLEIYFQQNAPFVTIQGISILIIRQLLKRKKDLKHKYMKIHQICSFGDNFFTNVYKMLKIVNNYRIMALKEIEVEEKLDSKKDRENIDLLRDIRNRGHKKITKNDKKFLNMELDTGKIAEIIKELLKRSDIMDEEYGKSITSQRFITAAMLCNIPNIQDMELILQLIKGEFQDIKRALPYYEVMSCEESKSLDKLGKAWSKTTVEKSQDSLNNLWTFSKLFTDKIQEQVIGVMGKIGTMGLYIESSLFNIGTN